MTRRVLAALAVPLLVALGADLLASEWPLVARVDGVTYLLPVLGQPAALRGVDRRALEARGGWGVWPPVPFGPLQTAAATGETNELPPPWAPSAAHPLGTDELGRDVAARIIHGTRVSAIVAVGAVALAVLLGVLFGALAGGLGRRWGAVFTRLIEVFSTFPSYFLIIALFAVLRETSPWRLVLVLGCTRWPETAWLVRAEVLALRRRDFVRAAQAMGAGWPWLLRRHLIPNALRPVVVTAVFGLSSAVLLEASVTFLGVGIAPPTASWGELLLEAHRNLLHPGAWWLAVFPGLALAACVLTFNALGERLRQAFDDSR